MRPFRNLLWLSAADFLARTLNFIAFVYLARVLGVESYGVLEFAISVMAYLVLLADAGLDIWGTRQTARGDPVVLLVSKVLPLRLIFASLALVVLFILLPFLPDYPGLDATLIVLGLVLFVQAGSLKWVFIGKERMRSVGIGLLSSQFVFALLVIRFVKSPSQVPGVAAFWLAGEIVAALYFIWLFFRTFIGTQRLDDTGQASLPTFTLHGTRLFLKPALTIGAINSLGILAYNFDALLLGFLSGPAQVGWYRAAYKPITAALSIPLTYFTGIFPALSRTYSDRTSLGQKETQFTQIVQRSLRISVIFAMLFAISGTFLAKPVILFLYGSQYAESILVMQILCWSVALVILRGTFRQSLLASENQNLDLRSAGIAVFVNVLLNLILINHYGMLGAAVATVFSDLVWLIVVYGYFTRRIMPVKFLALLAPPLLAGLIMGVFFYFAKEMFWLIRAALGIAIYFGVLFVLGESEVRSWIKALNARRSFSS